MPSPRTAESPLISSRRDHSGLPWSSWSWHEGCTPVSLYRRKLQHEVANLDGGACLSRGAEPFIMNCRNRANGHYSACRAICPPYRRARLPRCHRGRAIERRRQTDQPFTCASVVMAVIKRATIRALAEGLAMASCRVRFLLTAPSSRRW